MQKVVHVVLALLGFFSLAQAQDAAAGGRRPLFFASAYPELHPVASVREDEFFFSIKSHPVNFGLENAADIWAAKGAGVQGFSRPINSGPPLNNESGNFPMALSLDGAKLYLWNRDAASSSIAFSQRQGRNWQSPQAMRIENWEHGQILHWHVSIDEQYLLIAAIAPETGPDPDIFIAFRKNDETWSTPQPLGAPINSTARETSVFLAADGRTLYFASDRKGGQGGLDLYVCQRLGQSWTQWSTPQNLGPAINSPEDEQQLYLSAAGEQAYFVVGDPERDARIYTAPLSADVQPLRMFLLSGTVRQANTGLPATASLCLYSLDNNDTSLNRCGIRPDRNGVFQLLIPQSHTVGIYAEKKGYFSDSHYFTPGGQWNLAQDQEELLLADLRQNEPAYRSREKEIQNIQDTIRELNNLVRSMEQMRQGELTRFARLEYAQALQPLEYELDWPLLRSRYEATREQFTREAAIPDKPNTVGDASGDEAAPAFSGFDHAFPETAQGRILALRERQRLKQAQSQDSRDNAPALNLQLFDFERFQNALEAVIMLEIQDSLLLKMEKELLAASLFSLRGVLDDSQTPLLEPVAEQKMRKINAPEFENPLNHLQQYGMIAVNDPVRLAWQQPVADTLRRLMYPAIAQKMTPVLKNSVRAYLEFDLLHDLYQEQARQLSQKLELLTQKQIQLERAYRRKGISTTTAAAASATDTLTVLGVREMQIDIHLYAAEQCPKIRLDNIFFEANSAVLQEVSLLELQRLAGFLKQVRELGLNIEVHTNDLCTHAFARELTESRAAVIRDYLIAQGIESSRITAEGMGKYAPLVPNDSVQNRKANQRVEIAFTPLSN